MITRVRIIFQYWPLLQQLLLSFVTNLYNCVRLQSIHRCKHIQSIQRCLNKFHSRDSHGFHFALINICRKWTRVINFEWAAFKFNKVIHRFQKKNGGLKWTRLCGLFVIFEISKIAFFIILVAAEGVLNLPISITAYFVDKFALFLFVCLFFPEARFTGFFGAQH